MRIQQPEQPVGQFRELVVELASNPRVEKRDTLQQARYVRVFDGVRAHAQSSGRCRMLLGELRAEPGQIHELLVVIRQQFVGHHPPAVTENT